MFLLTVCSLPQKEKKRKKRKEKKRKEKKRGSEMEEFLISF
jgi:hypothetical protein